MTKPGNWGARKVTLYSNRILSPAITMYEKIGFREVPMVKDLYERSDIKMEILLEPVGEKL